MTQSLVLIIQQEEGKLGLSDTIKTISRESLWGGKRSGVGYCVEWLKHGLSKNKSIILGPQPLLCQMDHLYFLCTVFIFPFVFFTI